MNHQINEPINVICSFNIDKNSVMPHKLEWRGRVYTINKIGYYHKVRMGKNMLHIFSVCNDSLAFKLCLDADSLHWTLQEFYDGT